MKIDDIKVGDVLYTRVAGDMVEVRVARIDVRESGRYGSTRTQRRVIVRRVDNGRELPKARAASALHRNTHPGYLGSDTCGDGAGHGQHRGACERCGSEVS